MQASKLGRNRTDAERARQVEEVAGLAVGGKDVEDDRHRRAHDRVGVAARVRDAGVAALREDRVVILEHAQARDLARDEPLQIAERERRPSWTR